MMELQVIKFDSAKSAGKVEVTERNFAQEYNEPTVHQVVTAYLAGARQGTQKQKTRSEVRGGGKKPWRQKGTGRARAGSSRSPIWVGGGVAHAKTPRSYEQKVNKKVYRSAIRGILSELARQERLVIVDELVVETHKTKELLQKLQPHNISDALIVTEAFDQNLSYAANNVAKLEVTDVNHLNPVNLIRHEKVIMTLGVVKQLEERLA